MYSISQPQRQQRELIFDGSPTHLFIENLGSSVLCCVSLWKEHVNCWASTPKENTAFLGSKVYSRYQGNHLNVKCWAFRENSNLVKSGCLRAACPSVPNLRGKELSGSGPLWDGRSPAFTGAWLLRDRDGSSEFGQFVSVGKALNSREELKKVDDKGRQLLRAKNEVRDREEDMDVCLHPGLNSREQHGLFLPTNLQNLPLRFQDSPRLCITPFPTLS